jgi:Bacterial CdiA-CT RNAse A domain
VDEGRGQWRGRKGDSAAAGDDAQIELVQGDSLQGYPVDLREDEARGGHTIERHVGKSEAYLKTEVQEMARAMVERDEDPRGVRLGSFTSLQSATRLVNSTLAQNRDVVDEVIRGQRGGEEVDAIFDSPTGYEAYLPRRNLYRICVTLTAYAWSSLAIQALPEVTAYSRPFQDTEVAMPDQEEYVIEIYTSPKGVVVETVVNGKLEYLQAKMFLNMLTERTYKPECMPRPIPSATPTGTS